MRKVIFLLAFCTLMVQATTINVIDANNNHAVGNLSGVSAYYTSSLSGVTLSNYDAIYLDEHSGSFLTGYETQIRNAMMNDGLGLVFEYSSATTLAPLSTILGFSPTLSTAGDNYSSTIGTFALTTAGTNHMAFTGIGLEGGAAVNIATLNRVNRSKAYYTNVPTGVEILATTGGNPLILTGVLGQGRYFLVNVELLEGGSIQNELNLARNALFYVTQVPVPEPASIFMLLLAISGFFFYHRS